MPRESVAKAVGCVKFRGGKETSWINVVIYSEHLQEAPPTPNPFNWATGK